MNRRDLIVTGTIRGRSIELDGETGLPDGQPVRVALQPVKAVDRAAAEEAIRRSAGTWDDDPEGLEEFLRWNREQRKGSRPEIDA